MPRPHWPQPGGSEGTPARLRAQSRDQGPRGARNCPGNHCARTRKRGAGSGTDLRAQQLEEGFTLPLYCSSLEGGRAHRPSPSGGASFPARSGLTRYPGAPPPPPPPHTHPCAPPAFVRRCSRQWEHPGISAAELRSGRRQRSRSSHGRDKEGGRQERGEALSRSRRGVGPQGGGGRSALAVGCGARRSSHAVPCQPGLRRCICIRSSPGLSTLETTATPWAASGTSPSR